MENLANFFSDHIIEVYFLYGLSFFSMGLAILLESIRPSKLDLAKAIKLLAVFGLMHSIQIWFEMLLLARNSNLINTAPAWLSYIHLAWLVISFLTLIAFGARLIAGPSRPKYIMALMLTIVTIWGIGFIWLLLTKSDTHAVFNAADVYTRYSLAIPGTVLAAWGLNMQCQRFRDEGIPCYGRDISRAALAFALYGLIGQLFATPSPIFPSAYLNADQFVRWFGLPIQVFRALMAAIAAFYIIRSLRAFEVENQLHIEELRRARNAERQRLETTRAELLHRTVKAQEAERQRIALELHDETGQSLTALGLGLRGLSETIAVNPTKAIQQANQLEALAVQGLENLQHLVTNLRPPQLDDLGLSAAIRWLSKEFSNLHKLEVLTMIRGEDKHLTPDQRTVFFRVAQEALTNAIRHSQAVKIQIALDYSPNLTQLTIKDNGKGFDVDQAMIPNSNNPCWGLLGMKERAALIGALLKIESSLETGTSIELKLVKEENGNGEN